MNKLKFYALFVIYFIKRQKKPILLILGAIIVIATSAFTISKNLSTKVIIREGIIGNYTEKDIPEVVTRLLSSSLISVSQEGLPQPSLVKSWSVNNNGNLYTLKLNEDIYWTDGTKLRSYDIDNNVPGAQSFNVDDYTIQYKITDSFSPFLTLLNKPVFKSNTRIGTGPYFISKVIKENKTSFVKKIELNSKDITFPKISIYFYTNEKLAKSALKLGEIQAIFDINDYNDLASNKTISHWSKVNYAQLITIYYDTKDKVLSDENLRKALSYSTPKIDNEQEAITSIPDINWVFNKDIKSHLGNEENAKNLLKKVEKLDEVNITLTATSSLSEIGQKVVDSWNKLGIKSTLKIESGIPQSFQALLITQTIPLDPDQYALWHSTQTQTNISKISSPRIDKDLEDGRKATDSAVRKARYQDFQKVLMDQSPATFLYFPKTNVVYMKKIEPQIKKLLDIQIP